MPVKKRERKKKTALVWVSKLLVAVYFFCSKARLLQLLKHLINNSNTSHLQANVQITLLSTSTSSSSPAYKMGPGVANNYNTLKSLQKVINLTLSPKQNPVISLQYLALLFLSFDSFRYILE